MGKNKGMNWLKFISLINMIYGSKKIDIQKIQEMGLLAVKIGQVHALRLDFLKQEKCEQLALLYRKNNVIAAENVLSDIDMTHFKYFNEEPLACASIGQVYEAKLKDDQDVVVKIVKQNFKSNFSKDVASIKKLFKLYILVYSKIKKVFNPLGILNHIEEYTLQEMNLENEAKGQDILREIYEKNKTDENLKLLKFPKIFKELSNEKILVSEYIKGKTFDELLENKSLSYELLLDFFKIQGFYIFNIGVFHGDIHPGNIILSENSNDIYFIDTGYIGYAKLKIRQGLFSFFKGLVQYDYNACSEAMNNMSEVKILGEKYNHFQNKMLDLYKDFKGKTVLEMSLTRQMMETIKLGISNGMVFDESMFSIIKSFMFLDGMVLRCKPDAVLIEDMKPYINQFIIREY